MTRYFIDTEFIDDGKTIDLISIGMVCEDEREYYAQSSEFDSRHLNNWLTSNVLPHMHMCPRIKRVRLSPVLDVLADVGIHRYCSPDHVVLDCPWRTRKQLMYEVAAFVQPDDEHTPFELWGWCAGYDWVAICQLFGTMMDLPLGWPHYIRDLQYLLDEQGIADEDLPRQEGTAHNALEDARHIKKLWEYLT